MEFKTLKSCSQNSSVI